MNNWAYLTIAIISEVIATSALRKSADIMLLWLVVIAGYGCSFYFLSLTLRTIPVGIAYAVWSGVGIVLITIIAWILFDQKIDAAGLLGMGLIIAGVIVLNVFSSSSGH